MVVKEGGERTQADLEKTKTDEARQIPISSDLDTYLKGIIRRQHLTSQYVFSDECGGFIKDIKTAFESALSRAGITDLGGDPGIGHSFEIRDNKTRWGQKSSSQLRKKTGPGRGTTRTRAARSGMDGNHPARPGVNIRIHSFEIKDSSRTDTAVSQEKGGDTIRGRSRWAAWGSIADQGQF